MMNRNLDDFDANIRELIFSTRTDYSHGCETFMSVIETNDYTDGEMYVYNARDMTVDDALEWDCFTDIIRSVRENGYADDDTVYTVRYCLINEDGASGELINEFTFTAHDIEQYDKGKEQCQ